MSFAALRTPPEIRNPGHTAHYLGAGRAFDTHYIKQEIK
jgi:hypothetical protein